jgi:hypothetical protein
MTATADAPTKPDMGLFARIWGVIAAPRATMEWVVANPRPVGILFICALVLGLAAAAPMFTEAGQQAVLDSQVEARNAMGRPMSDQEYATMQRFAPYFSYFTIGQMFIFLPIISLVITALCWVVFNTVLGGTAAFKQVLAIVTHSNVIGTLGAVLGAPIQILQNKVTPGGPFNLGALVPFLDESSVVARFLSFTSVFTIWGFVVTGIGLAVLYRRKSANIAIGLIVAYTLIALGLMSAFS